MMWIWSLKAVFEDMGIKKEVFAKLAAVCKPGAFLPPILPSWM
jgi:3-hydroxyacyl-CoA dehydrogenase